MTDMKTLPVFFLLCAAISDSTFASEGISADKGNVIAVYAEDYCVQQPASDYLAKKITIDTGSGDPIVLHADSAGVRQQASPAAPVHSRRAYAAYQKMSAALPDHCLELIEKENAAIRDLSLRMDVIERRIQKIEAECSGLR